MTVSMEGREIVGIYLMLKKSEQKLDKTLSPLLARLEKTLYSVLSIEELEHLEELYLRNVDPFEKRG